MPHETAAVSAQVLCTPYNHAPCHFMQSLIRKVFACLAVTCHLHFWQNGGDLLRATAVTRGWNGYRNKSQHRRTPCHKPIVHHRITRTIRCCNHAMHACTDVDQDQPDVADQTIACTHTNRAAVVIQSRDTTLHCSISGQSYKPPLQ